MGARPLKTNIPGKTPESRGKPGIGSWGRSSPMCNAPARTEKNPRVHGKSIGSPGSLDWQTPEASTDRDQHSLDLVYDGGYNSAGLKWQLRYFDMNEDYEYKDPPSFVHSRAQTDNQGAQAQLSWNWNILTQVVFPQHEVAAGELVHRQV